MKLTAKVQDLLARMQTASRSEHGTARRWQAWKVYWTQEWNNVSHKRLYFASIVSAGILFTTSYSALTHIQAASQWTQVFTDGTYVGMVPNDPKVTKAMDQIALGYHVDVRYHNVNTFMPDNYDWQSVASIPTQAIAITLNGSPIVYTKDTDSAQNVLAAVQTALTPASLKDKSAAHFVGDVKYTPVIVGAANVMTEQTAVRFILHPTPSALNGRSDSLHALVASSDQLPNPNKNGQPLLQVGVEQTITKVVKIPFATKYVSDNSMGAGSVSVVKKGQPGEMKEQVALQYVNGKLVGERVIHKEVVQTPVQQVAKKGTNSGVASGNWLWPSPAYDITSPFGWRSLGGGEHHPGVDIGCPIGTPVYASNNGVVEDAGWNSGGYGNWVKINNGGGIETVFGHMSHVKVHAGQRVAKGQIIGYSGATGNVTGPHLHYEVRINGVAVEPHPYM